MDKKIREHFVFVQNEIKSIEISQQNSKPDQVRERLENLNNYHQSTVKDLQHERLIHLIVTFAFAFMIMIFIGAMFFFALNNLSLLAELASLIVIILMITEIFYVRYYYKLENGVQKLYELSKKLYDISRKIN